MMLDGAAAVFLLLTLPTSLLAALAVGCRAAAIARRCADEPAWALWLIALNLLEPPLNTLLIPLLSSAGRAPGAPAQLWTTLPMAVLLAPALGLRFRDAACRQVAWALLGLGGLRWLITLAIYQTAGDLALIGLGMFALWGSVIWGGAVLGRLGGRRLPHAQASRRAGWVRGTRPGRA